MKKSKGFDLTTIAMIAAAVAAGIYAVNRFTDAGVSGFGKPPTK